MRWEVRKTLVLSFGSLWSLSSSCGATSTGDASSKASTIIATLEFRLLAEMKTPVLSED